MQNQSYEDMFKTALMHPKVSAEVVSLLIHKSDFGLSEYLRWTAKGELQTVQLLCKYHDGSMVDIYQLSTITNDALMFLIVQEFINLNTVNTKSQNLLT
jgi:uncharacterized protein YihD (DUF1040 family)